MVIVQIELAAKLRDPFADLFGLQMQIFFSPSYFSLFCGYIGSVPAVSAAKLRAAIRLRICSDCNADFFVVESNALHISPSFIQSESRPLQRRQFLFHGGCIPCLSFRRNLLFSKAQAPQIFQHNAILIQPFEIVDIACPNAQRLRGNHHILNDACAVYQMVIMGIFLLIGHDDKSWRTISEPNSLFLPALSPSASSDRFSRRIPAA